MWICCTVCVLPFFTLDAWLLARSQHSEDPATGHLDTGFSRFPCAYKQTLRRFPTFQVITCFSCSPPDLNLVVTDFMFCLHAKWPLPPGDNPIAVNKYIIIILLYKFCRLSRLRLCFPYNCHHERRFPYPEFVDEYLFLVLVVTWKGAFQIRTSWIFLIHKLREIGQPRRRC